MSDYFTCPICGADVPIKARACPECGSDKETGWSDAAQYMHLLPDRGDSGWDTGKVKRRRLWITLVAVGILIALLIAQGWLWSLAFIPLLVLGSWIYEKSRNGIGGHSGVEQQLYQQLLQRAQGDKKLVQRLIAQEQRQYPNSNRLQQLQNAIYHWDRDRH
jgi:hypothetical protein